MKVSEAEANLQQLATRVIEDWVNGNLSDAIATMQSQNSMVAAYIATVVLLNLDKKSADMFRRRLYNEAIDVKMGV